jgi:uncharacterized protein (TIRG00374 family)
VARQITWKILRFVLLLTLGAAILYWIYSGQQAAYTAQCQLDGVAAEDCVLWKKLWHDFKSANFFWLGMTALAFTVSNWSRAVRWSMLIRQLGYKPRTRNAFMAVMISYFTNLYLSRMGEVVRAGYMARVERIHVGKVMGTVILDRLLDVVCMLFVIGLALVLQFNQVWSFLSSNAQIPGSSLVQQPLFWVMCVLFLAAGVFLVAIRGRLRHLSVYDKVKQMVLSLWEGFKTVRRLDRYWVFILHTINIWLMYYVMTYFCFLAFAPTAHLGLLPALTVYVFGAFGMVIPSPGGMGTYHALVIAALAIYGIDKVEAFSYANIMFFAIQIIYNVVFGGLAMALMTRLNRSYAPVEPVPVV